jgi:hypothetical protein
VKVEIPRLGALEEAVEGDEVPHQDAAHSR